jgi:hypothetical protein
LPLARKDPRALQQGLDLKDEEG